MKMLAVHKKDSFPHIVNETTIPIEPLSVNIIVEKKPTYDFLKFCLFCKKKMLPKKNINMYMRAFSCY